MLAAAAKYGIERLAGESWLEFEQRAIENIIRVHTTEADFEAVMAEKAGRKLYNASGEPWDHIGEMRGSMRDLERRTNNLKNSLSVCHEITG